MKIREAIQLTQPAGPAVLVFDIETSPINAWVWRCYKEYIAPQQIIEPGHVLCYAAKWLGSPVVLWDSMRGEKTDKRICRELWTLFDRADVVVAHNGQAFDEAYLRTRWVEHGIQPPSPPKSVDTCLLARRLFRFPSSKLDALGRYLGCGQKTEHEGFDLWTKCMAGDASAWRRMETYNINDVLLLEQVYMRLRAYDQRHPNVGLTYEDEVPRCPCCGSTALSLLSKPARTGVRSFPAYRCKRCRKVCRGGQHFGSTSQKPDVMRNTM